MKRWTNQKQRDIVASYVVGWANGGIRGGRGGGGGGVRGVLWTGLNIFMENSSSNKYNNKFNL
jgi:hypothetical protein